MSLAKEIKKRDPFDSPAQEALLNLLRTSSVIVEPFQRRFKDFQISEPMYNVLRILRGAGGDGLPSLEIGNRMITRVPDVTRIVDRLETLKLAQRHRSTEDRRVVLVKLTAEGRTLLKKLDRPIREIEAAILSHFTPNELQQFNRLLVKARQRVQAGLV